MAAALDIPSAGTIAPYTLHAVIGFLATTGMRRSDAVSLRMGMPPQKALGSSTGGPARRASCICWQRLTARSVPVLRREVQPHQMIR